MKHAARFAVNQIVVHQIILKYGCANRSLFSSLFSSIYLGIPHRNQLIQLVNPLNNPTQTMFSNRSQNHQYVKQHEVITVRF